MEYFAQIPAVVYPSIQDNGATNVALTNILTRSAFLREIVENSALFYEYQVKDGETPEVIADKLYGDPKRFWIVLLFNNLSNPSYDFPLVQEQLNAFIESKYGTSLAVAQSTIHHYEERITSIVYFNAVEQSRSENTYTISYYVQDENTGIAIPRPSLPSIPDSCIDGPTTTETFANGISVVTSTKYCNVTNYTYEFLENEKRRSIRLLDVQYVLTVESEFRRLMADGN
jgi:hypothetical protein